MDAKGNTMGNLERGDRPGHYNLKSDSGETLGTLLRYQRARYRNYAGNWGRHGWWAYLADGRKLPGGYNSRQEALDALRLALLRKS